MRRIPPSLPESQVTPKDVFLRRRQLLKLGATGALALGGASLLGPREARAGTGHNAKLSGVKPSAYKVDEKQTPFDSITHYNNFYEFGFDKSDPAANAGSLRPRPWTVSCEGECHKPQKLELDRLLKLSPLEERIYRFRCVEAWSMVIPWVGFPLASLIKRLEPTSRAKYVAFETLFDPEQMPGQKVSGGITYPYVEGLRIDEAMHPLSILAVGLYGEELPNQDGAPIRLVVPWKYGFKSIKSIVKIKLQETQPRTTWSEYGGGTEYGFYANVNPEVDHPRWSQAKERRIGEFFKRKTLMFNGYGSEVAQLYSGLDLRKFF